MEDREEIEEDRKYGMCPSVIIIIIINNVLYNNNKEKRTKDNQKWVYGRQKKGCVCVCMCDPYDFNNY